MFPLDSDLKQFLTDLVIEQNAPGGWLPSDDVLSLMIESIEDALIDAESLEPILEFLNALPSNKALERSESVFENDEDLMVAVENGLGALYRHSPVLFFASVVDPFALMELRDNIYEVLSPYWWEKIQHGGGREPRSPDEIWDEAMEEAGLIRKEVTAFDPSDGPRRFGPRRTRLSGSRLKARLHRRSRSNSRSSILRDGNWKSGSSIHFPRRGVVAMDA